MIATRTFVDDSLTPVRAYAALRHASPEGASFLLESVVGGERWGRFTVAGYRPRCELTLGRSGWVVRGPAEAAISTDASDPLDAARLLFARADAMDGPNPAARLARAYVGFFGWDLVHAIDKVPAWPKSSGPLARFAFGSTIVVFDNLAQTITLAAADEGELDRAAADLATAPALARIALPDRARIPPRVEADVDDERYAGMVRRAKEYISAGDAFQIVLARTFRVPSAGRDAFDVYRAMRVINPSPYMYFFDLPPTEGEATGHRTQIAGASPETLVRLEGGVMTVRPLAGTRPRGKTEEEDRTLERELLADPKERAEHVMLIDLGRNDVGRVAEIGSVELVRRMEVERYSHVMHIVSEVRGRVPEGIAPLDVVRAAFPAGTLSGAPKLRAMQIIRELEAGPRGIYGGAIGYVAKTGDLDFAIAIRTAVCHDGVFTVTAGAGVVEASVPQAEADETRSKARGVLCAIEAAPVC